MPGQKGNGGEREVSKLLQGWWQTEFPGITFARTPQSGGWVKNQSTQGFNLYGDVISTDPNFPFSVEVKRDESWNLAQLQKRCPTSPLWDWWLQCQADAAKSNKLPLLFFRKNRQPWYVWIPFDLRHSINERLTDDLSYKTLRPVQIFTQDQLCSVQYGKFRPSMVLAYDLLIIPPKIVQDAAQQFKQVLNPG